MSIVGGGRSTSANNTEILDRHETDDAHALYNHSCGRTKIHLPLTRARLYRVCVGWTAFIGRMRTACLSQLVASRPIRDYPRRGTRLSSIETYFASSCLEGGIVEGRPRLTIGSPKLPTQTASRILVCSRKRSTYISKRVLPAPRKAIDSVPHARHAGFCIERRGFWSVKWRGRQRGFPKAQSSFRPHSIQITFDFS